MARPKTIRKPSKRALARAERRLHRQARKCGAVIFSMDGRLLAPATGFSAGVSGAGGTVSITTVTSNATSGSITLTGAPSNVPVRENFERIESLDEGLTWHDAQTLEPAANRDGQLIIGTALCGPAPECMRPGSGVYSFEIERRMATQAEAATWISQHAATQIAWLASADERSERQARAKERARTLLLSHLSARQRRDLEERDGFFVTSQFGNLYWVTGRTAVRLDSRGVALQRYCIHATDTDVPADDNALLRMLLLKCNEEQFLRVANPGVPSEWDVWQRRRVPVVGVPQGAQGGQITAGVTGVGVGSGAGGNVTLVGGTAMVRAATGMAAEIDAGVYAHGGPGYNLVPAAGGNWTVVETPILPVLVYVNGIVRPLVG